MDYIDKILRNIENLIINNHYNEARLLLSDLERYKVESIYYQIISIIVKKEIEENNKLNNWLIMNLDIWCLDVKLFNIILYFAKEYNFDELFLKTYCFSYIIDQSQELSIYDNYIKEQWSSIKNQDIQIFQGVINIANQMTILTESIKSKGFDIISYSLESQNYLEYPVDQYYDFSKIEDLQVRTKEIIKFVANVIYKHNIFHFHFGISILSNYVDLYLIKKFEKKIVMQHWGSDVRTFELSMKLTPYPFAKIETLVIEANLNQLKKYVDICIVSDQELYFYVKNVYSKVEIIPIAINIKSSKYIIDKNCTLNEKFTIVHAPTSFEGKGTKFVNRAIENLQKKGYVINYKLVEGLSNEKALNIYKNADIVVDQLKIGINGFLTIENMLMGNPVIAYISPYMKQYQPLDLPVISADPNTIEDCLEYWMNHKDKLKQIGLSGKAYVEKYHDIDNISLRYIEIYQNLLEENKNEK